MTEDVTTLAELSRPESLQARDRYTVFGYTFDIVTRSAAARRLMHRLYARFAAAASISPTPVFGLESRGTGQSRTWRVVLDGEPSLERRSFGSALRNLEYEICRRVIEHRADLIVLHGATVFAAGGAALITGRSNAGKTTLALALAARGYRVGADDIAFLDPATGEVMPLPRCSHLDARSRRLLRATGLRLPADAARHVFVTPADLGPPAPVSGPVRHLFVTSRGRGAAPALTPLPQAAMVLVLMEECGWPADATPEALAALRNLVGGAACHRLVSGRLGRTVDAVAALLGPA